MNKNEIIKFNLEKRLTQTLDSFNALSNKEPIFQKLLAELNSFDFEIYKKIIEEEIKINLIEWWTNTKRGIIPSEELYAILFEYDYFLQKGVEATSYGIGEWKDYKVHTDEFDMGFDYDFTTEFYASPGMSVNFFDPLQILDHNEIEDKYKDVDIEEFSGYEEIIQLFKVKGMIAIHEVIVKLDKEGVFEKLNFKDNFMFIIDEHDSGEVYPLLIKSKKEESFSKNEILNQHQYLEENKNIVYQIKKWWQIWKNTTSNNGYDDHISLRTL